MNPGKLDRQIAIARRSGSLSDTGDASQSWAPVATTWAEIRHVRGDEAVRAATVYPRSDVFIRIRHEGDAAGVLASDIIMDDAGNYYNPEAILPVPGGRPKALEIYAETMAEGPTVTPDVGVTWQGGGAISW